MISLSSVGNSLKKFSGKPLAITSKALGAATVASVIYDAHVNAKEKAMINYQNATANRLYNNYAQLLVSDKQSATICKLKKAWFEIKQSFNLYKPLSQVSGYLSGFASTLIENVPEITFSTISLLGKGVFSKASGVLLALNGAKNLWNDVISSKYRKEDFSK